MPYVGFKLVLIIVLVTNFIVVDFASPTHEPKSPIGILQKRQPLPTLQLEERGVLDIPKPKPDVDVPKPDVPKPKPDVPEKEMPEPEVAEVTTFITEPPEPSDVIEEPNEPEPSEVETLP